MSYKKIIEIKHKKIHRYFYSWYLLPIIIIHELIHYFTALILNVKILKFDIFKNKDSVLYNGILRTEIPNKRWKQFLISYSPYLLLIPFFLSFFSSIALIISIYFLTTITKYHNTYLIIFRPSNADNEMYKYYDYKKYLSEEIGEIYYTLDNIMIDKIILEKKLFSYNNFKQMKK